jgi:hypothetical protein
VGEDDVMDRIIDLDRAAAEIVGRRAGWEADGLLVGPVTWRDEAASWPQRLEEDRERVADPDSVGVRITGSDEAELAVVLFRGGWADIDALTRVGDLVTEAPAVLTAQDFGRLLEDCVVRVFGTGPEAPVGR